MRDKAIYMYMGFTERVFFPTGMESTWWNHVRMYSSPKLTIYHPERWNKDPTEHLEQMRRLGINKVMLIGYSWGAGYGCINFAKKAQRYGIKIVTACLCDPVYRSGFLPSWLPFNPLSLTKHPKIKIPANVEEVYWVRQKQTLPSGHDLIPECRFKTKIHDPFILKVGHRWIDEAKEWNTLVGEQVAKFATLQNF